MLGARLGSLALVALGALACESRVSLGARCARDGECGSSLVCRLGACRVDCLRDEECGAAAHCVRAASGVGACTLPVEERCTVDVCPAPLVCRGDRCQAECDDAMDCLASQRCEGDVCVGATSDDAGVPDAAFDASSADAGPFRVMSRCADATECEGDEVCADDFGFEVCRRACDGHDDCPTASSCDFYDGPGGAPIFGCSTVCRPGTTEGCPSGTTCRMAFRDRTHILEGPTFLSLCAPFEPLGSEGCPCIDPTSGRECASGLLCVDLGADDACLRICADGEECAPGVACQIEPGAVVIGGLAYGTCPRVAEPAGCPL